MSTEGRRSTKHTKRTPRRAGGSAEKSKVVVVRKPKVLTSPALRRPSADSIDFCRTEFSGTRFVDCPVRRQFARAANEDAANPRSVLRTVIAGGGEVRLKLYITALWWATAEPHLIENVPASAWARALGLERYSTAGSKRVLDGMTWLTDNALLEATRARGSAATLRLLREDASEDDYHRPWWGHPRDANDAPQIPEVDRYFQIPREFWSSGWVSVLSGPALMCLCIHLDATWGWKGAGVTRRAAADDPRPATLRWYHFTESERRRRWTVSEDTWRRGNHELVAWGLVNRKARWSSGFQTRRQYFEYQVDLEAFTQNPIEVTPRPVRVSMLGGGGAHA